MWVTMDGRREGERCVGQADIQQPLAIDLFCGLGGWTEGLLAESYRVVGFDIEQHQYGEHRYPAQLVVQDVLTLHGSQFRSAALIVASPPCQEYSYMAMPWSLAKAKAKAIRADKTGSEIERLNRLFDACFRIQREACEAAGRCIPLIVENVRGAQPWVGRARFNYGSYYLWGDVPALMPITRRGGQKVVNQNPVHDAARKGPDGGWFNDAKRKGSGETGYLSQSGSKSKARKQASAMIAKIPLPLSRHIAATFRNG